MTGICQRSFEEIRKLTFEDGKSIISVTFLLRIVQIVG